MTVAIYARVSTEEQAKEGFSIATQLLNDQQSHCHKKADDKHKKRISERSQLNQFIQFSSQWSFA
ncbi:hypothetical protein D4T97_001900 [Siminovitchia acidinfaciens]|uniref:Resolvase/invertase-type recombinase catalytic domain-containing protein n=1 Tax=Siminovitchia acidinfaciens TaxID=2321395 RepID=A0A429Y738_9BACI|nr:hypothetical protein [Siminovitchia acidinfaciens]RST77269.1 hypothetical protein D4T97_001900 [Siminovitchia acidinfaciens]